MGVMDKVEKQMVSKTKVKIREKHEIKGKKRSGEVHSNNEIY